MKVIKMDLRQMLMIALVTYQLSLIELCVSEDTTGVIQLGPVEEVANLIKDLVEEPDSETDSEPDTVCCELGTAIYPALSCEQLMEACQVPSGVYYVRGASQTFYKVFCDMETFGGGWTRFGKGNMSSVWNYQNEDEVTTTIDTISTSDILKIQNMHFTEFRISTDVELRLQADDSINPSSLSFVPLLSTGPDLTSQGEMKIIGSADHTHLVFDTEGDRDSIECSSGTVTHTKCGTGSLPPAGSTSERLVILSAFFGPRAPGATALYDWWHRNKYTWKGSYYYLLAK